MTELFIGLFSNRTLLLRVNLKEMLYRVFVSLEVEIEDVYI